VGLEWLDDPESYADGSVSAGRLSLAGQVKVITGKGYPVSPGWGLGFGLTTPSCKANRMLRNLKVR
jgi:hypothetical protein